MPPSLWHFTILLCFGLLSVACKPIQPPAPTIPAVPPVITITFADDGITVPSQIQGGLVTLHLLDARSSPPPSEPQLVRLLDGATLDAYLQALGDNPIAASRMTSALGGAFGINHFVLTEGNYFVKLAGPPPTAGLPPMVALTVTGVAAVESLPTADVEVGIEQFHFAMPDEIAAGPKLWHIVNHGEQLHHLLIWQRHGGATYEELLEWIVRGGSSERPRMHWVLGWAATSPGEEGWVEIDLAAGEYDILSLLPDFSSTPPVRSQLQQGMHHILVVK